MRTNNERILIVHAITIEQVQCNMNALILLAYKFTILWDVIRVYYGIITVSLN